MKKKSRWLLLGLLPFMASCIPQTSYVAYIPSFSIDEFEDYTNVIRFGLADGLDLTAHFGYYDKSDIFHKPQLEDHYMFLTANNTQEDKSWSYYIGIVWTRLYDITDRSEDCYWDYRVGSDGQYGRRYSKEAKLHLDSTFFDPQHYSIEITLSPVDRYDPDKRIYTTNDLSTRSGIVVFYSIDENQTVSLASHPDLLPKTASSRPQASSEEQTIPVESSEESLSSSLA